NVVALDFFNKVKGGRLDLEQATLDIDISNKIGVDMQISINSLKAINNRTNTTVVLDAVPLRNPVDVMRATDANGQLPIQSSDIRIGLNAQNSNMLEFISNLPDQISYDLALHTNPLGNVSQHHDFIYDGEYMNLNMNLDIPMKISASGLSLSDTLLLNVEHEDLSAIKGGTLHAFFDNGFPMDARIEIYLLNAEGAVMDTLMNGSDSVEAALLNAEGLVEFSQQTRIDIPLDPSLLNSVLNTRKVAVVITLDTQPVNQFVRILDRYGIDFQLTADFTYSID
ncbi:MAG TPA: hypothetical protein VFX48_01230, partial [Saprospiraceae bacterium]|nr:hypothetical protein [Saprospiraceae bacterium]